MNKNGFTVLMVLVAGWMLLGASGCGKQVAVPPSEPVCMSLASKEDMMKAAEEVLKKKQFVIEKFDIDAGYIVTRPMRGSQFFEIWRGDNVGDVNKGRSSIHSIQRVVEMNFTPGNGQWCIACTADMQRFSMPEKQLRGHSHASRVFVEGGTSLMRLYPNTEEDMAWIDLGRDGELERNLIELIKQNLTKVK
jgi:hypothetical protein